MAAKHVALLRHSLPMLRADFSIADVTAACKAEMAKRVAK